MSKRMPPRRGSGQCIGELTRRDFLVRAGAAGSLALASSGGFADGLPPQGKAGSAGRDKAAGPEEASGDEQKAPSFTFPVDAPVRTRKHFYDLTPDEVNDLITAYKKLKDPGKQGDNRYWQRQAQLHGSHCGGQYMEVHGSWWFLPWHHCYLYFYERILASLSAHPDTFALPYWDWTAQRGIPNTAYNEAQGRPSPFFDNASPLYDEKRFPQDGFTFDANSNPNGHSPLVAYYTSSDYIINSLLMDPTFEDFGGGDPSAGGGPGDLEMHPHNNVHNWVGMIDPPYRDMGNLTYAALDLIFFLHHANVDRLWSDWRAMGNANPDKNSQPQWYSQWFNFYDETGKQVSVTVDDVDAGRTKIVYQKPKVSLALAGTPREIDLGGAPLELPEIRLPAGLPERLAKPALSQHRKPRIRILLEGIELPHSSPITLLFFVNKPRPNLKTALGGPQNVGAFTTVASSGHEHADKPSRPMNVSIDVTEKIRPLLQQDAKVRLTVVGVKPVGKKAIKVKFKKASLLIRD